MGLDGAPARPPRVAVVAMKPQLRGRIRRNVETLLDLGAEVLVITVYTGKDFFVGLEHPRLSVRFVQPVSVLETFNQYVRELNDRRAHRVTTRATALRPVGDVDWPDLVTLDTGPLVPLPEPLPRRTRSAASERLRRVELPRPTLPRVTLVHPTVPRVLLPDTETVRRAGRVVVRSPEARRALRLRFARTRLRLRRVRRLWRRKVRILRRAQRVWRRLLRRLHRARRLCGRYLWLSRRRIRRALTFCRRHLIVLRRRSRRTLRFWQRHIARTHRRNVRGAARRYRWTRKQLIIRTRGALRPWHRLSRWFDFWRKSRQEVLSWHPDLVASSDLPGLVGANRAARELRVPHLHDCHELYLESTHLRDLERRLLWPVERFFMRRASVVTCVNRSIAEEYGRRYGVRSVVVRNCAPRATLTSVTDIRPLAGLGADARVVLYQGGYAPGRGLEVLIQAAPSLPDDAHLVLLGDGRYRAELEQLVEAYDIGDKVHFVEAVPPAELLSVTASATVGVVPYQPVSMNNRLALPNKIFEYVAAGLPVIASDVPEMRRIVQESGAGALYDPYSPASLAEAMEQVLDRAHYEAFRNQATTYGETNCWENEQRILVGAYRRIKPDWPTVDVRDRAVVTADSPTYRLTG